VPGAPPGEPAGAPTLGNLFINFVCTLFL
jgi:hypothetical protein